MNRLFRLTGFACCLLAIFLASGGHWLTLQSIAWTRMLVDFARTDSIAQAIAKTFDGRHPCTLCLKIRASRSQEQKQIPPLIKWEQQRDLWLQDHFDPAPQPPDQTRHPISFKPRTYLDFIASPPKPPPRAA